MGYRTAYEYPVTDYDVQNMTDYPEPGLTRANVQNWLDTHAGDFQSITDFRADLGDWESAWESEGAEYTWMDMVYAEDE